MNTTQLKWFYLFLCFAIFLVIFYILLMTLFVENKVQRYYHDHHQQSWKEVQRGKWLKSLKEPIPESEEEARALAVNKVYHKKAKNCHNRNTTLKKNQTHCPFIHDMDKRKRRIQLKCLFSNTSMSRRQIDSDNILVLKYR